MATLTVDDVIAIPLGRAGKFGTLQVDTSRFTDTVQHYVYQYGLRQCLNDAIATKEDKDGVDLTVDQLVAKAKARLQNLYDGVLRARVAADAEPADLFEAACFRIALQDVTQALRPKFKDVPKGTKDRVLWLVNAARAKTGLEAFDRFGLYESVMAKNGESVKRRAQEEIDAATMLDDLIGQAG